MSEPFEVKFESFMTRVNKLKVAPTVSVAINGLAILCFSQRFNRAETGFLQLENHPLFLTIYNKNCQPVYDTPVQIHSGTSIKINHNNRGLGMIYTPDNGDIPSAADDKDFRHLISIDALHKKFSSERVELKPDFYLAKLYLSNGVFFTHRISKNSGTIINANPHEPVFREQLRKVGKVIGANIYDDEVVVEISSDTEKNISLKRSDADAPYFIVLRYKCNMIKSDETDFEKFYNVLELPPGHQKLDLKFTDVEPVELSDCEKNLEKSLAKKGDGIFSERKKIISRLVDNFFKAQEACQSAGKPECPTNLQGVPEPCP